jgi:hypothetical protein
MDFCTKFAKYSGMLFGMIAGVLVLFGVIGFLMNVTNHSTLFNVANYWNYLIASLPFSLLAICCSVFVIAAKAKN